MLMGLMIPCPFCGQLYTCETEAELNEEGRLLYVKRNCRCDGAKDWRTVQDAYEKIDRIIGDGAVEAGFDYGESVETVEAMKCVANDLVAGRYRMVQVTTPGGDSVKLSLEPGNVKVKRVSKKQLAI